MEFVVHVPETYLALLISKLFYRQGCLGWGRGGGVGAWCLDLTMLMQANPLLGPLEGVGPENLDLLGPNGTPQPFQ
jgi:hypothetical protein